MELEKFTDLTFMVSSKDIVTTTRWPHLLQTLILTLITFYLGIQLYRRKTVGRNKPIRDFDNIPGPTGLPIIGNLVEFAKPGLDVLKLLESSVKQYGKISKRTIFQYDTCVLCDPSHIQKLLSSTDEGHLNKPTRIYQTVGGDLIKRGLICSDYPTWKPHRKVISRLFTISGIQHKCRKEVDAVFDEKLQNTGQSSYSVDFTMRDLNNLEYLDRCVKENLRLAPVGPLFGRRLDKPLKLEENLDLHAGVLVGISPWVLHRIPEYFPDPEKFDPDRFLPEECAKRHSYAYLPFSAGPRNCIGSKVAQLSMKLTTAFILRHFVVETKDRWEDVEFLYDISLSTKQEINLSLKRRRDIS